MIGNPLKTPGQRLASIGCCALALLAFGVAAYMNWSTIRGHNQAENERSATTSLKLLASAQADLRANDRDANGVHDFWTADVTGLYRIGLIDRVLGEADAEPLLPLRPNPVPYKGYYFRALDADDSNPDSGMYRQDTDRNSGRVHNLSKFGFIAFPAEPGVTGKYIYIVNENNSVFRASATIPTPRNWFTDAERSKYWSMPQ
jgi:hypothetical protein